MRHALNVDLVTKGKQEVRAAMQQLLSVGRRKLTKNDLDSLTVLEVALEMLERGIRMKSIDLYRSDATRCVLDDGDILPPLTAFPGLGDAVALAIVKSREAGPFSSRDDFQRRTRCNRTIIDKFDQAGLLSTLPKSDQLDMWEGSHAETQVSEARMAKAVEQDLQPGNSEIISERGNVQAEAVSSSRSTRQPRSKKGARKSGMSEDDSYDCQNMLL